MDALVNSNIVLRPAAGTAIRGVFSPGSRDTAPCVAFAHGLGSDRRGEKAAALATECARRGWAFGAFDFRAHGASDGAMVDLRGSQLLEDLNVICRFVSDRTRGRFFLVGSSMGGWATAWYAARNTRAVAGCALIAPAFHLLEWRTLSPADREAWRRSGRRRLHDGPLDLELGYGFCEEGPRFPVDELAQLLRTPAIIFHGMEDEHVPFNDSVSFLQRSFIEFGELRLFKGGDHRLNSFKEDIARSSCDFFQRFL
jgi:uncharacterized protein